MLGAEDAKSTEVATVLHTCFDLTWLVKVDCCSRVMSYRTLVGSGAILRGGGGESMIHPHT